MKFLIAAMLALAAAVPAQAKCGLPPLELLWSYPTRGAVDVPTNSQLWVLVPYPWATPVVRLDGKELALEPEASRGVIHVSPGPLLPDHGYVLQLDFTSVRSGEDAGVNALMEIPFRTGSSIAKAPAKPELGAHTQSAPTSPAVPLGGGCPEILKAQDCLDVGPLTVHSFAAQGEAPLAWMVDGRVIPARCDAPQFHAHSSESKRCVAVEQIGAGGLRGTSTVACTNAEDAGVRADGDRSSDEIAEERSFGTGARNDDGCHVAHGSSFAWVLLALLRRRRHS